MPKVVVDKVEAACKAGNHTPAMEAYMKKNPDASCHDVGEAIAAMVEEKMAMFTPEEIEMFGIEEFGGPGSGRYSAGSGEKIDAHLKLASDHLDAVMREPKGSGKAMTFLGVASTNIRKAMNLADPTGTKTAKELGGHLDRLNERLRSAGEHHNTTVGHYEAKLTDIKDFEIWRAGKTLDGRTVTEEQLDHVLTSFAEFNKNGYEAPVIVGHNNRGEEKPAVGFVYALKKVGKSLLADIKQVPLDIAEAMKSAFKNRSVEIVTNVKKDGKTYPFLLRAVALLGSTPPAFAGLGLPNANPYSGEFGEVLSFDIDLDKISKEESDLKTIEELQTELSDKELDFKAQLDESNKVLAEKEKLLSEEKGKLTTMQTEQVHKDSIEKFNSFVAEFKIFPTQKDAFVSLYNALQTKTEKVSFFELKENKLEEAKEGKTLPILFKEFIDAIPAKEALKVLFMDKMKSEAKGVGEENLEVPAESYAAKSIEEADAIKKYAKENELDLKKSADYVKAQRAVRKQANEEEK